MSETVFPYAGADVDDWFKRCMASRPAITPAYKSKWTGEMTGNDMMNRYPIHPTHESWIRWFNKWFSQFNEKSP